MQITSMSVRILAAMIAAGSAVAFAGTYQWAGGDGRWADSTKWNPNGVPGTGAGRHVLLASTSELAEPAVGSSVIVENVPVNCTVRVSRSADTKSLVCMVAPQGTTIIFR